MRLPTFLESLRVRLVAAWRDRAVSLKALSFATVGLINTAVDATIFFLMLGFVTSSLILANVTGWLVAVTGSYVMNSSITFAAESGRKLRWRAYAAFVASGVVGWLANTATLLVAAETLFLPIWLAKAVAILASFVVNFSLSHFIVFRPRRAVSGDVEGDV